MEIELKSTSGFYNYWFSQLIAMENRYKTKIEVFNDVNILYAYMYRTTKGKYDNYNSFIMELKLIHFNPEQLN